MMQWRYTQTHAHAITSCKSKRMQQTYYYQLFTVGYRFLGEDASVQRNNATRMDRPRTDNTRHGR